MEQEPEVIRIRPQTSRKRPVTGRSSAFKDTIEEKGLKISEITEEFKENKVSAEASKVLDTMKAKTYIEFLSKDDEKGIKFLEAQVAKLDDISLLEKNPEELYNWNTILKMKRPISSLKEIKERNAKIECTKKQEKAKKDFQFPIALIDAKEEDLEGFIKIHKHTSAKRKKMEQASNLATNSNTIAGSKRKPITSISSRAKTATYHDELVPKLINAARPQSVYTKRNENEIFYMSKDVNDYFTQSFKDFAEKFSLLHPKVRCNSSKLRRTLTQTKLKSLRFEEILESMKKTKDVEFETKNLFLAGNSKNIDPLLRSYAKQINSQEFLDIIQVVDGKYYFQSNKPLGFSTESIDYKENVQRKHMEDLHKSLNIRLDKTQESMGYSNKGRYTERITYEMYDESDPALAPFKDLIEEERKNMHSLKNIQEYQIKEEDSKEEFIDIVEDEFDKFKTMKEHSSRIQSGNKPLRPGTGIHKPLRVNTALNRNSNKSSSELPQSKLFRNEAINNLMKNEKISEEAKLITQQVESNATKKKKKKKKKN